MLSRRDFIRKAAIIAGAAAIPSALRGAGTAARPAATTAAKGATPAAQSLADQKIALDNSYDIIVAGGGPAGCAAATAAAQKGRRVLLIEAGGSLGGLGTSGMVPAWCPFTDGEKIIYRGLAEQVFREAKKGVPHEPADKFDWVTINPEYLIGVYDRLVADSGADILFFSRVAAVEMDADDRIDAVVVANKNGLTAYRAPLFIDATGDGDLCAWAGAEFLKGDADGVLQKSTLCFSVANVNTDAYLNGPELHSGHNPCDFSQAAANALNYTAVNVSGTGVKSSPYFVEQPDASADVLFSVGGVTDAKGTEAASGSSLSTVCLATKSIPATYENFVHQAQQSEQHNTAELLELKNGDGWTRRIYLSFPLADVPENATRIGVRMHFESFVAASLGSEKRYFNAIDTLELSGNTEKYTDKLTWDNHHSHKFEPVAKAILTQDMAGSWIGWDVTDFVKAKAAEGKEQVTFRVTTPLEWRTLTRFSSSRNTANPGYGPVMLLTTAIPAGIETVETDSDPATDPADTSASTSASAEYYTLQGTRIFGTPHGLVIRRIGSRVEKLLIK